MSTKELIEELIEKLRDNVNSKVKNLIKNALLEGMCNMEFQEDYEKDPNCIDEWVNLLFTESEKLI